MMSQAKKTRARSVQSSLQDPDDGTLSFGPRNEDRERRTEGMPRMHYRPASDANLGFDSNLGFCLTSEDLETSPDYFESNIKKRPGFGQHAPQPSRSRRGAPNGRYFQ